MKYSYVPLGGLVTISGGGTPSRNNDAYWGGSIPWATVKDLKDTTLSGTQETITPEGLRDSASNLIPAGSVIVATRMGLGKVTINTIDVTINQDLKAFSCGADLNQRYLMYYLLVNASHLDSMGKGATVKGITLDVLKDLSIPLPPLPEQKRIAAILDKADSIRRKRQEAVRLTEKLLRSTFLDMFGDPVTNPKRWPFRNLGDEFDVRDGTHDSPKYVTEGGYPLVTSKNLTGGTVDLTYVNFISETDYDQINKRSRVDCGDIIMPMIGTIGSPVLVDQVPNYAIKNIALIKSTKQSPSAVFVLHLLSSHYFDHIIGQKSRGGTQQFVSLGDLRSFPLPLPPSELQTEFARRISAVKKLINSHLSSMSELDALFNTLLQRAFKGLL